MSDFFLFLLDWLNIHNDPEVLWKNYTLPVGYLFDIDVFWHGLEFKSMKTIMQTAKLQ